MKASELQQLQSFEDADVLTLAFSNHRGRETSGHQCLKHQIGAPRDFESFEHNNKQLNVKPQCHPKHWEANESETTAINAITYLVKQNLISFIGESISFLSVPKQTKYPVNQSRFFSIFLFLSSFLSPMNFFESNRWISRTEAASPRELPHPTRTLPIVYPGDEQESKAFFKLVRGSSRRTREEPQTRTGKQKSRTPHLFGGDLVLLALLLALRWAPCNCLSPWINSYTSKSLCLDILIFITYCQFSDLSNDTKPQNPKTPKPHEARKIN